MWQHTHRCMPCLVLVLCLLAGWGLNVLFGYILSVRDGVTVVGTKEGDDVSQVCVCMCVLCSAVFV
jgi:hypothetical protein